MAGSLTVNTLNGVDVSVSPPATQAFANSYDLGVNQTWQDMTASRVSGVTYTNSTGKPIVVIFGGSGFSATGRGYMYVDGRLVGDVPSVSGIAYAPRMQAIVPNGSTYSCTQGQMSSPLICYELR